jgi:hypothetical protein
MLYVILRGGNRTKQNYFRQHKITELVLVHFWVPTTSAALRHTTDEILCYFFWARAFRITGLCSTDPAFVRWLREKSLETSMKIAVSRVEIWTSGLPDTRTRVPCRPAGQGVFHGGLQHGFACRIRKAAQISGPADLFLLFLLFHFIFVKI